MWTGLLVWSKPTFIYQHLFVLHALVYSPSYPQPNSATTKTVTTKVQPQTKRPLGTLWNEIKRWLEWNLLNISRNLYGLICAVVSILQPSGFSDVLSSRWCRPLDTLSSFSNRWSYGFAFGAMANSAILFFRQEFRPFILPAWAIGTQFSFITTAVYRWLVLI